MEVDVMESLCRICLHLVTGTDYRIKLSSTYNEDTITQIIKDCANVQIYERSNISKFICWTCYRDLMEQNQFCQIIKRTDTRLKEILNDTILIEFVDDDARDPFDL